MSNRQAPLKRQQTIASLLSPESFSRSAPIANKKLKGKSTKGMVKVKMKDENNTEIWFEDTTEQERCMPIYKAAMMNTEDRKRLAKIDKSVRDISNIYLHQKQ